MGQVTDTKGNPIPGATVRLIEIDAGVPGILDTTTDSMGFYSITDNPGSYDGRYTITAFASGFESSGVTIQKISMGFPIPPQNLMLPRIGILAGIVTDTNGTPLTEAHVLVGKTPDTFSLSSPTDSTGHYSIMVDPPGAYNAVAGQSGFEDSDPASITVTLDTITPKDFPLVKAMPGSITGVVMDLDTGDPIEGATVEAIVDPPSASQTTETDATGNYTLSNVLSGRRQVSATARGYSGEVQTVKVIAGPQPVIADPFTLKRKRSRRA
jgi:hypothetical protein